MEANNDLLTRIENQQWKFADTYAETAPHEYILHKWNIELFKEICQLINTTARYTLKKMTSYAR